MNVMVNIINNWCIVMSQAAIVPSLHDDGDFSFRGIACEGDTHTHTHTFTHTLGVVYVKQTV